VHGLLQNPQCAAEVLVSVSQPVAPFMSQSAVPAPQLDTPHTPALHTGVPDGAVQIVVQSPQWLGSAAVFVSQPLNRPPSQSWKPGSQPVSSHVPALHVAEAFEMTQLPQSRVTPQPDGAMPHDRLSETHVWGVQPHWFNTPPPPQVCGAAQVPQSIVWLHVSDTRPHEASSCAQFFGLHCPEPHLF
jgi:hypothetical protein